MNKKSIFLTLILVVTFSMMSVSETFAAAKVTLNKSEVYLHVGESSKLALNNVLKKNQKNIVWKSAGKKIAKVSKTGKVTGVSNGVVTVKATYKKKTYNCKVTVVKEWTKEEINTLIEALVQAGLQNSMTKEEIIKLIEEKTAGVGAGGGSAAVVPSTPQVSQPSIYPNKAFVHNTPYGQKVEIETITLGTTVENDLDAWHESGQAYFPGKYSLPITITGKVDPKWAGEQIHIAFYAGISEPVWQGGWEKQIIASNGEFEYKVTLGSNQKLEEIYIGQISFGIEQ